MLARGWELLYGNLWRMRKKRIVTLEDKIHGGTIKKLHVTIEIPLFATKTIFQQ